MSRAWQPGQLLFVGFEGEAPSTELCSWIREGRVGGVILFTRNFGGADGQDPGRVRAMIHDLRRLAPPQAPLCVAIDHEGGRVQRLRSPWTVWPSMREVAEAGDVGVTGAVARAMATELLDLGINLNFAPVLDVDTNPRNPIIGDRSFGDTPAAVIRHGNAFVTAMQDCGLAACGKHFPGHGDTHCDSHLELPRVHHDVDRLRTVELAPFAAAAKAGIAALMTAHVVFEAIDAKRPATLSPDAMQWLRDGCGSEVLVFSDDLEMKAVLDHYSPRQMTLGALEAGVDALLVCREQSLAREVLQTLEKASDARVEHALARMVAFKRQWASQPPTLRGGPPYPEHRELAGRFGVPALGHVE